MRFLFRSHDGLCLPQALRVKSEGNQVKLSVEEPKYENAGNGLVEKAMNFARAVEWADVVVYDPKGDDLPKEAERVRKTKPLVGSSELGGLLENDRKFGIDIATKAGIKCPEVEEFAGPAAFRKAREFVGSKPTSVDWVWKANGDHPEGARSYVSKDGRNGMLRMLKYVEKLYRDENIKPDFIVTTKIEGVEVSTEAWFNGHDFVLPNHTLERNKFFPGDLGEKVGCCGNVVWPVGLDSPLYRKLLEPLRATLDGRFVGPLDVNAIIEKKTNEPMFLEFSPRFGYDAIFALMELVPDFGQFLADLAHGQVPEYKIHDVFAGDVRLTIPPFPAKADEGEAVGVPIFGFASSYNKHQHPVEVMLDYDDQPVTSGPSGFVLSVSGTGDSPSTAQDAAYKQVEKVRIPNMRYRNDLTTVIDEIYDDLVETGWLGKVSNNPLALPQRRIRK